MREDERGAVGMFEPPICVSCRHLHRRDPDGFTCAAYPKGIPFAIVTSAVDHHRPYRGDHGIRWAPLPPGEAPRATDLTPEEAEALSSG